MEQYLCFDVGGSMIKYGVLSEDGKVLFHDKSPTNSHLGADDLICQLLYIINEVKLKYAVKYIAVATTGIVDIMTGSLLRGISSKISGYESIRLKELFEEKTGLVTEVENDVNCVALAESWLGGARGYRNLVCITIGTGIGGALLIDGQLYHGSANMAMEIGRIPIYPSTLEDLASVRALVYEYAKLNNLPTNSVDGLLVAKREREGDPSAVKAFDIMCHYLAQGIAAIVSMLTPDAIVIGGAIATDHDIIDARIKNNLEKILDRALYETVNIRYAGLGNLAGMVGSLHHHKIMSERRKRGSKFGKVV